MSSPVLLIAFILFALGAGALGSIPTMRSIPTWYVTLRKPSWNPPNWLFGPVWTVLYALMAVAAWLVWSQAGFGDTTWWLLYIAQLALNVLWSYIFFGMKSPGVALVEVVVFWMSIFATTVVFWQHAPLAGMLMLPYLAWVAFASVLNANIWRLNRPGGAR